MKRPYVKLYVDDFFGSFNVQHMTTEQIGAYFLLLMSASQVNDITLPDDDKKLATICRMNKNKFEKNKETLKKCFTLLDGKLHNAKLKKVLEDYDKSVERQREKINKRWSNEREKSNTEVLPQNYQPEPITNNQNQFKNLIKSDSLNEDTTALVEDDKAQGPYQTDNTIANQIATNELLAELENSQTIVETIGMQTACNPYEAGQMRNMFVNHIRATGLTSNNYTQLRSHCVNWCCSHAKRLIHAIHNTPQMPRPGRDES